MRPPGALGLELGFERTTLERAIPARAHAIAEVFASAESPDRAHP